MTETGVIQGPFPLIDLVTEPPFPDQLRVNYELMQALAWLVAWDGAARRLVRCDPNGNLSTAPAWCRYAQADTDSGQAGVGAWTAITAPHVNEMAAIVTSAYPIAARVYRVAAGDYYEIALPANYIYVICHPVEQVSVQAFPTGAGTASYVGLNVYY